MDHIYIVILVFLGSLCLVLLMHYFSKKEVIKRKLRKETTKKIGQCKDAEIAKIVGKIESLGEPLYAPLSGRRCVYYHVLVEEKRSSGKNSSWHDLVEEEISGKFLVRNGEDCAIVDTRNIKTYLVPDKQFSSGFMNDAPLRLEKYLQLHGKESTGLFGFNRTLRYKEGILEEGETIAVVGKAFWKETEQEIIPTPDGKVLMISASPEEPVYLSDDPGTL